MVWHHTSMVAFDTETTGTRVEEDRIVTACLADLTPGDGQWQVDVTSFLINPGVDIPEEATAIHGITTAHAKEHGQPPAETVDVIADRLAAAVRAGVPLVGMNVSFDLTVLDRELRRYHLPTVEDRAGAPISPVIDVFVIDKHVDRFRRGSRRLADLCATYHVQSGDAHDSTHDAIAAARVAYRLGQLSQLGEDRLLAVFAHRRDPDELAAAFAALGRMTLTELHHAQVAWRREQMASFADYRRRIGQPLDDVDGSWPIRPYERTHR